MNFSYKAADQQGDAALRVEEAEVFML